MIFLVLDSTLYREIATPFQFRLRGLPSFSMRVLLISDVYFPRINGVSSSIQTFLRGISQTKSDIEEAFLIAPDYGVYWDDEGHNVIRVRSYPTPGDHEDLSMYGYEIRKLLPRLRKLSLDVVHSKKLFAISFLGT